MRVSFAQMSQVHYYDQALQIICTDVDCSSALRHLVYVLRIQFPTELFRRSLLQKNCNEPIAEVGNDKNIMLMQFSLPATVEDDARSYCSINHYLAYMGSLTELAKMATKKVGQRLQDMLKVCNAIQQSCIRLCRGPGQGPLTMFATAVLNKAVQGF